MNEELRNRILEIPTSLDILDLGCGSPTDWFCFYKHFSNKINKYVGIDYKDEFNIFHTKTSENEPPKRYEYIQNELMNNLFNNNICDPLLDEQELVLDLEEFCKHFEFHFLKDAKDYLQTLPVECCFDIIVLSNILHKIDSDDADYVFSECLQHIKKDGLIYFSVLGSKYKNPAKEDKLFTHERYNRMKEKVKILWCCEKEEYHFQFIGTLKM